MRWLSPDFPFAPSRVPFFYGWSIAAVSTLGFLMSIPGQTMGVSVFTDYLIEATGVSRVGVSNAYLVGTLLAGLMLPLAGTWLDRLGARLTIVAASLLLGATLILLSRIDKLAAVFAATGLPVAASAFAALVFGFFLVRFSGQGVLTLVGRTLIGRWFDGLRGIVSGVQGPFISFGFSLAPQLLQFWIDRASWRGAWVQMAFVVGIGMSFVGWLVYRDTPEQCGLAMDGRAPEGESGTHPSVSREPEPEYTRAQAMRTRLYWAFSLGLALQGLSITGITFHIIDIGAEAGMTAQEVLWIWPKNAVFSVTTALLVGWLTSRAPLPVLLAGMMAGQALGVFSAAHLDHPVLYWTTIVGLGISGGCFGPLSTVAFPRYFGRTHLGAINASMLQLTVWGSAIGPFVMALSRQYAGSYSTALHVCALLPLGVAVFGLLARTPPRVPETSG